MVFVLNSEVMFSVCWEKLSYASLLVWKSSVVSRPRLLRFLFCPFCKLLFTLAVCQVTAIHSVTTERTHVNAATSRLGLDLCASVLTFRFKLEMGVVFTWRVLMFLPLKH